MVSKLKFFLLRRKALCGALVVSAAIIVIPGVLLASGSQAPVVSDIKVESVEEHAATVTWKTDKDSFGLINYSLDPTFGIARTSVADKLTHSLKLEPLSQGTTYYFRVTSIDTDGNQSISGGMSLSTKGYDLPIKDVVQRNITGKILDLLDKITSADAIALITEKVTTVAGKIEGGFSITGLPRIEEIGVDTALVSWTTDRDSSTMVSFSADPDYKEGADYTFTQGDPNSRESKHKIKVIGLKPGTTYHIQAFSEDDAHLSARSEDATFHTKSPLPEIKSVQLVKVEDTSATIMWSTVAPASGVVEYTNIATKEVKLSGSLQFTPSHTARLEGLVLGARYKVVVRAENEAGEKAVSKPITFITVKDETPPIISKVTNESTLYPTSDAKVQTIVSWTTDEIAFCQFFYREGISETADPVSLTAESEPLTDHVQVVVSFLPATVYKFWVECKDKANNKSVSETFVLFTPDKEKSIIDVILENFQGTFGWVKNIGK